MLAVNVAFYTFVENSSANGKSYKQRHNSVTTMVERVEELRHDAKLALHCCIKPNTFHTIFLPMPLIRDAEKCT